MLDPQTIQHFKLTRDPFVDEFDSATQTFTFEMHAIAEAMIWQAALHRGFLAVVGGYGSGKTTLVRRAMAEIHERHAHVTLVECPTTSVEKLSDAGLMELLLLHLAPGDSIPNTRVRRGVLLSKLLHTHHAQKRTCVLVIDEAHRLGIPGFRALKGLYEYTADARRLLGIILVGQPPLAAHLKNVQIPDVAARCEVVSLEGMGKEVRPYLEWKLRAAGRQLADCFSPDAIQVITTHLNGDASPLRINNLVSQTLRLACWTGQPVVTDEIVLQALQEG
jgi:type II secretory pathway predicted ATPase ExeA